MSRLEEIKNRLKATEGLKNPDADDISHDHNVGFPIEDERCELYANSKSDIEYLLAELVNLEQKLARAVEALREIGDATHFDRSVLGLANQASLTLKEIGEHNG